MAGHSKFANIKHRKWAQDKIRWKVFTKHAKLISIAAREWADPEMNSALKNAIESAKAENVPNDNIKRAIEKWSWAGANAVNYQEVIYESYAPWWSALIIEALTDNKVRTMSNVKSILNKNWWKFAEPGSVWYMFEKKWIIEISTESKNIEDLEMFILESWAEDFDICENEKVAKITTILNEVAEIKNKFVESWYEIKKFWPEFIANQKMDLDEENAEKVFNLIEKIEEDDDVSIVYTNLN